MAGAHEGRLSEQETVAQLRNAEVPMCMKMAESELIELHATIMKGTISKDEAHAEEARIKAETELNQVEAEFQADTTQGSFYILVNPCSGGQ